MTRHNGGTLILPVLVLTLLFFRFTGELHTESAVIVFLVTEGLL